MQLVVRFLRGAAVRFLALLIAALPLEAGFGLLSPAVAQTPADDEAAASREERLFEAVFNDDLDGVKVSIADGADIDRRGMLGRTPVELAIDLGHFEIAHYLLALSRHRRALVTAAEPPKAVPPPPFVPLRTLPEVPAGAPEVAVTGVSVPPVAQAPRQPEAAAPAPEPARVVARTPPTPAREPSRAIEKTPPPVPPIREPARVVAKAPPPAPPARESSRVVAKAPPPAPPAQESSRVVEKAPPPAPPVREPVRVVATAPPPAAAVAPPSGPGSSVVRSLGLGTSLVLGQGPPSGEVRDETRCINKAAKRIAICVVPVAWPSDVAQHFVVESFVYKGAKALVRYEDGISVGMYAQFPAESFESVVAHHVRVLGPPEDVREAPVALAGKPESWNTIVWWRQRNGDGGAETVVEIRRYDDVRRSLGDPRYGVIQTFRDGATPVFARVSALDLMRLR